MPLEHFGNYIEISSFTFDTEKSASYYGKFMLADLPINGKAFIYGGELETISVYVDDDLKLTFQQGTVKLKSNILIEENKIYKFIIAYEYDDITPQNSNWSMKISQGNGVILDTVITDDFELVDDVLDFNIGYKEDVGQFRGIIGVPIIFTRSLTNEEQTILFSQEAFETTGVTWDSSFNTITIQPTGTLITKVISKGVPYINFMVNIPSFGPGDVASISNDNGQTWQFAPNNTLTTFNTVNTEGIKLRVYSQNGLTISNARNAFGELVSAGITVRLQ